MEEKLQNQKTGSTKNLVNSKTGGNNNILDQMGAPQPIGTAVMETFDPNFAPLPLLECAYKLSEDSYREISKWKYLLNVKELRFSENQKMAKKDFEMHLNCLFDSDSKNNTSSNIEVIDLSNTYIGSKKNS